MKKSIIVLLVLAISAILLSFTIYRNSPSTKHSTANYTTRMQHATVIRAAMPVKTANIVSIALKTAALVESASNHMKV